MTILIHRTIESVQVPTTEQRCSLCQRLFASASELRLHVHRCAVAHLPVESAVD